MGLTEGALWLSVPCTGDRVRACLSLSAVQPSVRVILSKMLFSQSSISFAASTATAGRPPFRFAVYVGDSMEDVMMVKEAAKTDSRFLSAGVYRHSRPKNVIILDFLKSKCDMVLPSVNELPLVLKKMSVDES